MWKSPWRKELEAVLSAIIDRLGALESTPPPEDHLPAISRLQANLGTLTDQERAVADLRFEMVALGARVESLGESHTALQDDAKRTMLAVSDGIERVDRAHHRIKATVARAKAELKKLGYTDPGLAAEDRELRLVDGGGSEPVGLQPVSEDVGISEDAPSSVPGVTIGQLMRATEQR